MFTNVEHSGGSRQTHGTRKRQSARDSSPGTQRKTRILVVEDEIFVAWHLESVLRDLGYGVCGLVPDGRGAVAKADALEAELVLMDINLKGDMDGVEAARRIREVGDAAIIFITAYSDPSTLSRIEKAIPGAAVLAKPVSPNRLRSAIERALEARSD